MAEYTYKDIIIDPTSEEAKNAIGKKCYIYDSPTMILRLANKDEEVRTLESIDEESEYPFKDKEFGNEWLCLIVKKEEPKPKYVPFSSMEEFISAYDKADDMIMSSTESMLSCFGMWLKCGEHYELVTYIHNNGITIDNISINWKTLFDSYTFLDNTPCGKEVEDV